MSDPDTLAGRIAPYDTHERLVLWLERDGGDSGYVTVHITGDLAAVSHSTMAGGIDSYCLDAAYDGPDELVPVLMDNGQEDRYHRCWMVPRADGLRALDYFLRHGDRDPGLTWVSDFSSLEERP